MVLRRFSVAVILVMFFVVTAFSQNFTKGVKGGLNFATFGGADAGNVDSRTTFNAGAFVSYPLSNLLSIQPEVLFTMKGASDKVDFGGTTVTITVKLTYIEIPVLFKLNVPVEGASFAPFLYAGPSLGIKMSAKAKAEGGGETVEEDLEDVKSTDFGLNLGAGAQFGPVIIDIRYNLGLTSIDDSADPDDLKNRVFSFNVGFAF